MERLIELLVLVGSTIGVGVSVVTLLVALGKLAEVCFEIIRSAFEAATAAVKFSRELQKPS